MSSVEAKEGLCFTGCYYLRGGKRGWEESVGEGTVLGEVGSMTDTNVGNVFVELNII